MASSGELIGENTGVIERTAPNEVRVRRALMSVSDKSGLLDFARGLQELDVELVSTGGTARELARADIAARPIEDFTGFPEIMDGRVKTLHPRLYAGLLARRDEDSHLQAAEEQGIEPVDLVIVNLYPFEQTLARGDASEQEIIENIDIGGPTMIRAAAKNVAFAAVVVDPSDYPAVLAELREHDGRLSGGTRSELARKAFATTARYDAAISGWFSRSSEGFPPSWSEAYEKVLDLRYGENPHQQGAFYSRAGAGPHLLEGVNQLHGKELSYNNLLDLSSARELVEDFDEPACAIVKHNNPCGCAVADSAEQAYARAFACDPQSAYGGVIALNRPVDRGGRREAVRPVHRGAAGALLRARRAGDPADEEKRPPARAARLARPQRARRGPRRARRPARADPRRGRRDARADARHDRRRAGRAAVAGPPVRVAGVPSRPLQRDRHRPRPAPRSGSAPAR